MSAAYLGSVLAREGNTVVIRIYQRHPDYGLDPKYFVAEWGAMAIAGWAYSEIYARTNFSLSNTSNPGAAFLPGKEPTALARAFGPFGNLFDAPASAVPGLSVKKVELVRSAYNDFNTAERLVAAGYAPEQSLTHDVVSKICGILDLTIEAEDPAVLVPISVGVEWEF
jgi:hypothetical protein